MGTRDGVKTPLVRAGTYRKLALSYTRVQVFLTMKRPSELVSLARSHAAAC